MLLIKYYKCIYMVRFNKKHCQMFYQTPINSAPLKNSFVKTIKIENETLNI